METIIARKNGRQIPVRLLVSATVEKIPASDPWITGAAL
jgi:hypothetical protein